MTLPHQKRTTYIYGLREPGKEEYRYIGSSVTPDTRLVKHRAPTTRELKALPPRVLWNIDLRKRGLRPEMVILEACHWDDRNATERKWIRHFQQMGHRLTNAPSGARPGSGRPRSLKPPLKKTAVTLEEWQVDWLRQYGNGSVSAGVRRLVNILHLPLQGDLNTFGTPDPIGLPGLTGPPGEESRPRAHRHPRPAAEEKTNLPSEDSEGRR